MVLDVANARNGAIALASNSVFAVAIGKWNRNWASCSAQNRSRIVRRTTACAYFAGFGRRLRNRLRILLDSLDEFFIGQYTRPKLDFRRLLRRIVRSCEQ